MLSIGSLIALRPAASTNRVILVVHQVEEKRGQVCDRVKIPKSPFAEMDDSVIGVVIVDILEIRGITQRQGGAETGPDSVVKLKS